MPESYGTPERAAHRLTDSPTSPTSPDSPTRAHSPQAARLQLWNGPSAGLARARGSGLSAGSLPFDPDLSVQDVPERMARSAPFAGRRRNRRRAFARSASRSRSRSAASRRRRPAAFRQFFSLQPTAAPMARHERPRRRMRTMRRSCRAQRSSRGRVRRLARAACRAVHAARQRPDSTRRRCLRKAERPARRAALPSRCRTRPTRRADTASTSSPTSASGRPCMVWKASHLPMSRLASRAALAIVPGSTGQKSLWRGSCRAGAGPASSEAASASGPASSGAAPGRAQAGTSACRSRSSRLRRSRRAASASARAARAGDTFGSQPRSRAMRSGSPSAGSGRPPGRPASAARKRAFDWQKQNRQIPPPSRTSDRPQRLHAAGGPAGRNAGRFMRLRLPRRRRPAAVDGRSRNGRSAPRSDCQDGRIPCTPRTAPSATETPAAASRPPPFPAARGRCQQPVNNRRRAAARKCGLFFGCGRISSHSRELPSRGCSRPGSCCFRTGRLVFVPGSIAREPDRTDRACRRMAIRRPARQPAPQSMTGGGGRQRSSARPPLGTPGGRISRFSAGSQGRGRPPDGLVRPVRAAESGRPGRNPPPGRSGAAQGPLRGRPPPPSPCSAGGPW